VVGEVISDPHIWSGGAVTALGTLPGVTQSPSVCAINDHAQAVGYAFVSGVGNRACTWNGVTMTLLPGATLSGAYGINNHGDIVGSASVDGYSHACIWSGGAMTDLGTLGGTSCVAYDINDHGQIVGSITTTSGQQRLFLYHDGETAYSDPPSGGQWIVDASINASGQVAGTFDTGTAWFRPFLYTGGTMTVLGWSGDGGNDINARGQVVGGKYLYSDGVVTDVESLITTPGWTLLGLNAINDDGVIAGFGWSGPSTPYHACLLIPIPEPAVSTLLFLGVAALVSARRRPR
jgi:probable HAF family extracellular repeat protein